MDVSEVDALPSPFSMKAACWLRGMEEMYPPWALFDEWSGDRVERLVTQRFRLDEAPEALKRVTGHPAETMKVVIELGGEGS